MQVETMRQNAAKEAQAAADAKEAAHKTELAGYRTSARNAATGNVNDYFSGRGIDPEQYGGSIASQLNTIGGGISPTDENPGAAYTGAGQTIYDTLQQGERTKASSALDRMFAPNFETNRVPWTLDDPYQKAFEEEQYADADKIIKNMMDRGVLTQAGYGTAQKDLENQRAGVRSRINEVGTGLISGEQGALRDIANKGRQSAGQLQLGQQFDPYTYQAEADQSFNDFIGSLGGNLRAGLPGKLFNTAGLAAVGGAGQGLTNTAFNPAAAAGVDEEDPADKENKATNPNSIF
jgi:hypothetical protein